MTFTSVYGSFSHCNISTSDNASSSFYLMVAGVSCAGATKFIPSKWCNVCENHTLDTKLLTLKEGHSLSPKS